jgi:hypothetical protein
MHIDSHFYRQRVCVQALSFSFLFLLVPTPVRALKAELMCSDSMPVVIVRSLTISSFYAAATLKAVNSLLLSSHEGFLRFFPAWPLGERASFRGLRASGDIISLCWLQHKVGLIP